MRRMIGRMWDGFEGLAGWEMAVGSDANRKLETVSATRLTAWYKHDAESLYWGYSWENWVDEDIDDDTTGDEKITTTPPFFLRPQLAPSYRQIIEPLGIKSSHYRIYQHSLSFLLFLGIWGTERERAYPPILYQVRLHQAAIQLHNQIHN